MSEPLRKILTNPLGSVAAAISPSVNSLSEILIDMGFSASYTVRLSLFSSSSRMYTFA